MNKVIEQYQLRPTIDRTFSFEKSCEAFRHLELGQHFGKIVIQIN